MVCITVKPLTVQKNS